MGVCPPKGIFTDIPHLKEYYIRNIFKSGDTKIHVPTDMCKAICPSFFEGGIENSYPVKKRGTRRCVCETRMPPAVTNFQSKSGKISESMSYILNALLRISSFSWENVINPITSQ